MDNETFNEFFRQAGDWLERMAELELNVGLPRGAEDVEQSCDGYVSQLGDDVSFYVQEWPTAAASFSRMTILTAGLAATGQFQLEDAPQSGRWTLLAHNVKRCSAQWRDY